MLILELTLNPLFLDAPLWGPPRMMAAIYLGEGVLPPPATFDSGVLVAALLVHFPLSIIYAMFIGAIIRKTGKAEGFILGLLGGAVIYYVNFYVFTAFFPWFNGARNWVQVIIHLIFAVTAAMSYLAIRKARPKPQK